MAGTLISIISVFIGIISAHLTGYFFKNSSFGFTGNTLVGVFGSIFLVKSFGRLGFDPWAIVANGTFHSSLFIINCLVSALGGVLGLFFIKWVYVKMNSNKP